MDSNRGKTGQDIADLERAAEKSRRDLESAYRWTSHCYSMLDRACQNVTDKERAFDLAQRAVKLAQHKVGAVAVAFAAVGLGDPIAALLG